MCVFWMKRGNHVTVSNVMEIWELRQTWIELHSFLKKMIYYYDKNPERRRLVENRMHGSIENTLGKVEHTLYTFDRFKNQIKRNDFLRAQMTMQAIEIRQDMKEISKVMKAKYNIDL